MAGKRHDDQRRRASGLLGISVSLPAIASVALRKRGFVQARLATDWPAIVGEEIAEKAIPQKLVAPPKGGARLHVRVESAFAVELKHIEPQVLERINAFFGYRAVEKLFLEHGAVPPRKKPRPKILQAEPAANPLLERIEDAGLRESLRRLGRAVGAGRGPQL